jgi:hypothetical protein
MYCQLNFFLNLFGTDNSPHKITHRRHLFESAVFFIYFLGGLECIGHSFAYASHFVFLRDVWIQISEQVQSELKATANVQG